MALDLTPFRRAMAHLTAGIAAARAAPGDEFMRDGVIQRFKYTFETSHRCLRRYLEETEPAPGRVRQLDIPGLIRLGAERDLILGDRNAWVEHEKARRDAVLAHDHEEAAEIFAHIPAFVDDARELLAALEGRLAAAPA